MTNDIKRGFTVAEAADYIGRSESFVRKLKNENRLPAFRDGKALTFLKEHLDEYLNNLEAA